MIPAVIVVSGLPGSGKSFHVEQQMVEGDLVVDMDAIFAALSGLPFRQKPDHLLPYVAAARDAIYERLKKPINAVLTAWIITCDRAEAEKLSRYFRGKHIHIEVPESERISRLEIREAANG